MVVPLDDRNREHTVVSSTNLGLKLLFFVFRSNRQNHAMQPPIESSAGFAADTACSTVRSGFSGRHRCAESPSSLKPGCECTCRMLVETDPTDSPCGASNSDSDSGSSSNSLKIDSAPPQNARTIEIGSTSYQDRIIGRTNHSFTKHEWISFTKSLNCYCSTDRKDGHGS